MAEERVFLHKISNPLAVAYGILEVELELMRLKQSSVPDNIDRIEKALKALNKIIDLLNERRQFITSSSLVNSLNHSKLKIE